MNKQTSADATGTGKPAQLVPFPVVPGIVPHTRSARRHWLIGGVIALVVLVGAATAWWLMRQTLRSIIRQLRSRAALSRIP